jgi:membrane fusion protein (multidrug efflux system)
MLKKFIIAIVGFVLVVALLGAVKVAQIKKMSSMPHTMPASSVTTTVAREETWAPILSAVATLAPVQGVTLGTDADGIISKIVVENGADVKAGDVLLEFDTRVEAAQRSAELRAKNTISQAELDQATAQMNQAASDAGALRAQMEKKIVRAPFDGRVGIRMVNVGQFVSRGSPLLPLQKLDQMYVNFTIPQRELPSLAVGQVVNVKVDAFNERVFSGKITAINPEVDASSRNVSVQALVGNPNASLRAGMFAHVAVELPVSAPSIVLPATAVSYASYGNSVFIIETMKNPDGTEYLGARQQFVKLGVTKGDLIAILEGVKPGEVIATAGVFKLRNGLPVQVNNSVLPASNPAPKPANT